MKLIQEFKEFAVKGNMVDLAIGIIIGNAFNTIVSSFVKDIIMPPFGYILGNIDFSDLKIILKPPTYNDNGNIVNDAVTINYGIFLEHVVDFLIIAFSIFIAIRLVNKLRRKSENEKEESVPTPKNIQLLAEIRDLLKENTQSPHKKDRQ